MRKDSDYTFVTIDNDTEATLNDAVVIDVDYDGDLLAAVSIDNETDTADFITFAGDSILFSDADMDDIISSDMNGGDISIML